MATKVTTVGLHIGGRPMLTGHTLPVRNKYTGEILAYVAEADAAAVVRAVVDDCEEVFGPVVTVVPFDSIDEAIRW